ncbi:helix-turn-helix domain-containing protein [Mucilaginibacter polytrichastri]|uniref:HTH cro/C1-type domain-containing protein n=1 Tax=Mucilaginibacter polytrichastri TaxID=1302689 RepID=A0A1Q5ZVM7_9SPHI|nr:helix-turn-helix domain-containing protein [Mucilaginibacter polytrichastri]OKS85793.1 hypothetical protein RG47T_1239 [Mucilaginibacter polytrichastri]SFS61459.1 Cro/C1-type HTH DNA-binding domain-containing protein [Mucilaginibacter polytrichastri]
MSDNQHDIFFARIEQNIRQHAKHQKITLSELSSGIDMTEAGFYKMLSTESVKVKTLRKIAEVLKLPIQLFFEECTLTKNVNGYIRKSEPNELPNQAEYLTERDALKKQIELLESQINDKNKIIELMGKK